MNTHIYKIVASICLSIFLCHCIEVHGQQCNGPLLSNIDSITTESVYLNWVDFNGSGTEWAISYDLSSVPLEGHTMSFSSSTKSAKIEGLLSGSAYHAYIRAICSNADSSEWSGPFLFVTAIDNQASCMLNLPIADNNCPRTEDFIIHVTEFLDAVLGSDVFIQSVDLIIDHDWPADLSLELISPSGNSVLLSSNRGIGLDHYGNPYGTSCSQVASFTEFVCDPDQMPNDSVIVGRFRPVESFNILYDDSPVNGNWKLRVCDAAIDDRGILKKIFINLSPTLCNIPTDLAAVNVTNTGADILWLPQENCDVSIIHIVPEGDIPSDGTALFTPCQSGKFTISGLQPNTAYDVYVQSSCQELQSPLSCPFTFVTACDTVTLSESFDFIPVCETSCLTQCNVINSLWNNISGDHTDWVIHNQSTPTDFTGPDEDVSGFGQYVYTENSIELCGIEQTSILETQCLYIPEAVSECTMSFYYHLYGDDIGSLCLLIQSDQINSWDTLFFISGNRGNLWTQQFIDLSDYKNSYATLRFIGTTGIGDRADLAIDQIDFYLPTLALEIPTYYFDFDRDGFGGIDSIISICLDNPPDGYVRNDLDCDDSDPFINPDARELGCNALDDDCNGIVDDVETSNTLNIVLVSQIQESCPDKEDGRLEIKITGGSPPYQVSWNNGDEGMIADNLTDGVYFAEVTDADFCQVRTPFYDIDVTSDPELLLTQVGNTSCGQEIGSISVASGGGIAPYTFNWNNGAESEDIVNLAEGSYSVTITDQVGCQDSINNIKVNAAPRFTSGIQFQRNLRCQGDKNGLISVAVLNAVDPVIYQWSTGDSTTSITGLAAGTYFLTIVDGRGCIDVLETEITEPNPLNSQITGIENITCPGGEDGSIQVSTIGGQAPYSFRWVNINGNEIENSRVEDITHLGEGDYFLIATDANGCLDTSDIVSVRPPEPIDIGVETIKSTSCRFSSDGSIIVNASGGNGGFEYFWNNGQRSDTLQNVTSGVYSLRVIDDFGCKAGNNDLSVNFSNVPLTLIPTLLSKNECAFDSMASIGIEIGAAAQLPIDFNWSVGNQMIKSSFKDTISNLPSGTYQLTATDNEGCVGISDEFVIDRLDELVITGIEKIDVDCSSDSTGQISIDVIGGVKPLSYIWNDGEELKDRASLPGGTYSLSISDANGCTIVSEDIEVKSQKQFSISSSLTHANGDHPEGRIEIFITEGNPPYNIAWTGRTETGLVLTDLLPGSYCLEISDAQGCSINQCFLIKNSTSSKDIIQTFLLSPNPCKEFLHIQSNLIVEEILIYDMHGRLILNEISPKSINVATLTPGLYLAYLRSGKKHEIQKFVKI